MFVVNRSTLTDNDNFWAHASQQSHRNYFCPQTYQRSRIFSGEELCADSLTRLDEQYEALLIKRKFGNALDDVINRCESREARNGR